MFFGRLRTMRRNCPDLGVKIDFFPACPEDLARARCGDNAEFEREGMALHVAVARRQMGRLLDNQSGQALVDDADAWMIAQGIKNTRRMTELLAPGFES